MVMSKISKYLVIIIMTVNLTLLYYYVVLPSQHLIVVLSPGEHSILFEKHIKNSYRHKFNPNLVFADLTEGNDTLPLSIGRYFTVKYLKKGSDGKFVSLTAEEESEIEHMIITNSDGSLLDIYKW
jgi:hypothetical protein